jgi:RES domain-containing protein
MRLWRIARSAYRELDGEGARVHGGRWNSEGNAVVYTSSTASLAALELLVHLDIEDLPLDLVLIEIEVPYDASIQEVGLERLPDGWNLVPDHPDCVAIGDEWSHSKTSLLLRVPSAVVPKDTNVLINPEHAEARRVTVLAAEPFQLDRRLIE